MNEKTKVAVAIIANRFEAGGERYEALREAASVWMEKEGFDCILQTAMVWNGQDALNTCKMFEAQNPDVLMIIHASWVQDSIQHIFTNRLKLPTILLAVPYIETFSLACAQHYGAQLNRYGLPYKIVYGLPGEIKVSGEVRSFVLAASAYQRLRQSVAGVIGPRQTFRIAAAQDMTMEEWDFSRCFGSAILHIEYEELLCAADAVPKEAVNGMMADVHKRTDLKVIVENDRLAFCIRIYLAVKQLRETYGLSYCAAQCYPNYGGICNLAACILSDEGYVLDTEGDIGHAALLYAYSAMGGGAACLSEAGGLEAKYMYLEHEGSAALSLKPRDFCATLRECGDGSMMGFILKEMKEATIASIGIKNSKPAVFTIEGSVKPVDPGVWESLEGRFLGAFAPSTQTTMEMYSRMLSLGVDHHFALKEGFHAACINELCSMLGLVHIAI